MKLEFQEYQVKKIVNVHKHADSWFWDKYSAMPYVGCRSGCEFCYLRGGHYGHREPEQFDTLIKVKTNAVELLKKELPRLQPEVICCGDWQQPAESRYQLSRQMLGIVCQHSFPLFIVERSPLLLRDLDILQEIHKRTHVSVVYSMSNVDPRLKRAFEPHSPGLSLRFKAMKTLADAGILVGTALMPIIPFAGDDRAHLEDTVRASKDHGGTFVLAGGLTMDGVQARRTLEAARRVDPNLETRFRQLYHWEEGKKPGYSPPPGSSHRVELVVRELCERHGLKDRMPRYIAPGPLAANKRVAELLFLKLHQLELEQAAGYRIWAYRKAAWTIDEWPESIAGIYQARGTNGLKELPGIGQSLAGEISRWLQSGIPGSPFKKGSAKSS
jgi:DNA repair photolyase